MSTRDSPPPIDAGELLVSDHRQLEELFAQLEDPSGGGDRSDLIRQVISDLSLTHAIKEVVLYPAARHELPDGDAVADEALAEGRAIKELLVRLERLEARSPEVDEVLGQPRRDGPGVGPAAAAAACARRRPRRHRRRLLAVVAGRVPPMWLALGAGTRARCR